jgi:uncharacterized protein YbjT (DUF2867 family)
MLKSALLVGSTGLVGRACLDQLLAADRYDRITTLGRRAPPVSNPKLTHRFAELAAMPDHVEALQADDIFCALGTTQRKAGSREAFRAVDLDAVAQLASAAARGNATQLLVVSSVGANPAARSFYLQVKGQMEAAVSAVPLASVHVFRPSLLLGHRGERRLGEMIGAIVLRVARPLLRGRYARYRSIAAEDVAAAMVIAAGRERRGRFIYESDEIAALAASAVA